MDEKEGVWKGLPQKQGPLEEYLD